MNRLVLCALLFCVGSMAAQETSEATPPEASDPVQEIPASAASAKPITIVCKGGEDTRTIKNTLPASGGCDVTYTKNGESQSVASAQHELEYCQEVVRKIQTTLEGAGFKCQVQRAP